MVSTHLETLDLRAAEQEEMEAKSMVKQEGATVKMRTNKRARGNNRTIRPRVTRVVTQQQ